VILSVDKGHFFEPYIILKPRLRKVVKRK